MTDQVSGSHATAAPICQFQDRLSDALLRASDSQAKSTTDSSHDHAHAHDHHAHAAGQDTFTPDEHGHTHEHLEDAGKYSERDMPDYSGRDWNERAFTIGIGG